MNARLRTALEQAIGACRREAARIRRNLPEEDGAIDAGPRKTRDGLWESDAFEWDEDARLIQAMLTDPIGGPTTVVKELETENARLRAELARRVPNPDDLEALLMLAGHGIPAHSMQLREAGASDKSVRDIENARHRVLERVRATLPATHENGGTK